MAPDREANPTSLCQHLIICLSKSHFQKRKMSSTYQDDALRTLSTQFHIGDAADDVTPDLLHGAIGLSTEAGEMLDAVKRALFYGGDLDRTNLIEELGDLEWYMAVIRDALNVSQEEVQQINIEKLRARYPEKFSTDHALQRDLGRERAVLENGSGPQSSTG